MNQVIVEKNEAMYKSYDARIARTSTNKEIKRLAKECNEKKDRVVHLYMCKYTVRFIYSTMFYFSEQSPEPVVNIIEEENKRIGDVELTSKKVKYKYKYTGYINLSKMSLHKPIINQQLEEKKKEEWEKKNRPFTRHIEKWSVRGHWRNFSDKKIWIDPHYRGSGHLEPRVYGLVPESEVNVMQKVFEIEREVACAVPHNYKQDVEKVVAENNLFKQQEPAIEAIEIEQPQVENIVFPKDNIVLDKENIFQKIIRVIKEKIQSIFNTDTIET